MRHNKSGRRLGRNSSHRSAMMRNMTISLLSHERIQTTDARAKELRKIAERMITLGKRGDLHARRQALQALNDKKAVAKLFDMIAPRYKERPGGYTRIIKLSPRLGDNAPQSLIELVEEEFTSRPRKQAPVVPTATSVNLPGESTESSAEKE
jgi:large subunit ribosomal protein L17